MPRATTIDAYVRQLPTEVREIAEEVLRTVINAAPKARASIKWAQPVFDYDGPFAFLRGAQKHVTLGFWRGLELTDPRGLLEGAGEKMAHIKVRSVADLPRDQIVRWVKEAMLLNSAGGDPTRRAAAPSNKAAPAKKKAAPAKKKATARKKAAPAKKKATATKKAAPAKKKATAKKKTGPAKKKAAVKRATAAKR